MPRPSRDQVLMRQAEIVAERSTCTRGAVGTVIAHDGRSVVSGYNGAPVGMPHCDHTCICNGSGVPARLVPIDGHLPNCSTITPCTVAVHAEANAIAFAARHGLTTEGASLHTTMAPCTACAMLIINAGIVRVLYGNKYRDMHGAQLLIQAGVEVRFTPRVGWGVG